MDDPRLFFGVPSHLNKGKRLAGFPRDEIIPAAVLFGFCYWQSAPLLGMALAFAWFGGLRYVKVEYGENIIALTFYWWAEAWLSRTYFHRTPAAQKRYWIF
jgi:conjugal transfer pilus assembly protein TraL